MESKYTYRTLHICIYINTVNGSNEKGFGNEHTILEKKTFQPSCKTCIK